MAGKPKPAFFVAVALVVLGLLLFALYRADILAPKPKADQGTGGTGGAGDNRIDPSKLGTGATPEDTADTSAVTTVKEYEFVPSSRLPEVKGTAAYKPLENNTVRFALNVWAGWAPILYANNGLAAGKVWKTPAGEDFRVELVLIDDPIQMQDAYAVRRSAHRLGYAGHGAPVSRADRGTRWHSQRQPRDAADLPASRLVQRR